MWEDPIVKEVRQARLEIEQECDNDFRKIYERAVQIQRKIAKKKASEHSATSKKNVLLSN